MVESAHEIETEGKGTDLGGVGGAGRGIDVMTVVGAVGGALAGNEIEKRVRSTKSCRITVRFGDGSSRAFSESSLPVWRPGDRVRIIDGQIRPGKA